MDQNTIGGRIRDLRKAKNLTQEELAVLMNSSRVQINQWETGSREISAGRIVEFASALDASCEYLLRGISVEKSDSYNQTGLDMHSLNAFSDIMELQEHKKKQYLSVLNGILGSDCFWHSVMPHILAALSIQENAVLGGAYAGLKDFSPDCIREKLKESIQTVTFGNSSGYMDHILINKETAIAFQIQEAADIFKQLIKAIVDRQSVLRQNSLAPYTLPYRSNRNSDEEIGINEFVDYMKAIGLTIDCAVGGKDEK